MSEREDATIPEGAVRVSKWPPETKARGRTCGKHGHPMGKWRSVRSPEYPDGGYIRVYVRWCRCGAVVEDSSWVTLLGRR